MNRTKTKVLLCSPLGEKGAGGIARWTQRILEYYKSLDNKSVDLVQFYPDSGSVVGNTPLYKRVFIGIKSYSVMLFELYHRLKNDTFDVVHLCSSASIGLIRDYLVIKIAHKFRSKIVVHFRFGRIPELYEKRNLEYKLIKAVITNADSVLVIDEASYNTLIRAGHTNVSKLANPLSPRVMSIIDNNKSIERIANKIVFAGHVVNSKGIRELIAACSNIDNIKLYIYGRINDDMRNALTHTTGTKNREWLEIMGERDGDEVIRAMLSAGIFVLPTYTEGFPNVIIESMACGCPIITTPVGAIPEMLDINGDNNCGICVPVRDTAKLQDAIEKMLKNSSYARECGANAQKRVIELCSIDVIWAKLQQLWQTI